MKKTKSIAPVVLPASRKSAPKNAKPTGKVPTDERFQVTVRLRRKPGATTPRVEGKPLTREEFRDAYGADPADIEKVEEFANEHGLDVVATSIAQRAVKLSGTAKAMQAAFGVQFKRYRIAKTKRTFRGRVGTISVPKDLANIVEGVFGLDNRPQAMPHFHICPKTRNPKPRTDGAKPMTPPQVAKLYNFPSNLDGRGECIAIIELGGGFRATDLTAYFKSLGIKEPKVSAVSIGGAHNEPDGPTKDANGEVMLDIEVAGAVAPGSKIAVYFAPNTDEGFLNALNAAIHDNVRNPSVISISWGSAEAGWTDQAKRDFDSTCSDGALQLPQVTTERLIPMTLARTART
jgi:kumamolisin